MTIFAAHEQECAGWVTVPTADGPMRAYRAPATEPRQDAAIVVLQEAFGVNDHIRDVARRIAAEGYLALAPDLFHRSGAGVIDYSDRAAAMAEINALGIRELTTDARAAVAYLRDVEGVALERVAVLGFCFGGRAAFTAATACSGIGGTVVFYGPGIAHGPHAVLSRVNSIGCPVLFLVGEQDPTIPRDDLDAIAAACGGAGVDLRVVVFPGVGHAFHCDARPAMYDSGAAEAAWATARDFLATTVGASAVTALAGVPMLNLRDLPPALAARLRPRVERLGYLGDFFRLAGHQPDALAAFVDFTEACRGALPEDLAELVALTVATHTRNDYERHQHERLATKLGMSDEWIGAVESLDPMRAELSTAHRAAQRWLLAALADHGHGSQGALADLVEVLGAPTTVAIALLAGRYAMHATFVNAFGVGPAVPSIFDAEGANRPQGTTR